MADENSQAWHRRDHSRDLTGLAWLEADVLRVVWGEGEVTGCDVSERLRETRRIAYTTLMSVRRNLAARGLLEQDKSRPAYVYRPSVSDARVARGILDAVVDEIMGGDTRAAQRLPPAGPQGRLTDVLLSWGSLPPAAIAWGMGLGPRPAAARVRP